MDRGKNMKKILVILSVLALLSPSIPAEEDGRVIVLSSDSDVFYTLISTPLSFLLHAPLLIFHENLSSSHIKFLNAYNAENLIVVGGHISCNYPEKEFYGDPANVSLKIAREFYGKTEKILLIPQNMSYYNLSIIATQIACYEKIPLILYDGNKEEVEEICREKEVEKIISVGDMGIDGYNEIHLNNESQIYSYLMKLKGDYDYAVLTNPRDAIPAEVIGEEIKEYDGHIKNFKIILFAHEINILGNDSQSFIIKMPDGINRVYVDINVPENGNAFPHIISAYVYRGKEMITYSFSNACEVGKCHLEFYSINAGGDYRIVVKIYRGIKGGFFSQRGISLVNTTFHLKVRMEKMESVHESLITLSPLAPYLASFHNGIVVTSENEITDKEYQKILSGKAGGAWNNPAIHPYINEKVNETVEKIERLNENVGLRWLALLGDTNMLPRYYYKSSTGDSYVGYGLPSDDPYSLNFSVATGRVIAQDEIDASLLIARTLFYGEICQGGWMNKFNFITGEGFGETAGLFHQIPYSIELRKNGFETHLFGIFRNGRKNLERMNAFDANFVEYEGHGDWYWMLSSIYGMDFYSRVVDVAHVEKYNFPPNVILTAACLMGRLDGIPLKSSISMAFIHAGSVAVVSSTRETGGEATLKIIEDELIYNHSSLGEAVVKSNKMTEEPTKYVRILYGDPAFKPYIPHSFISPS